VGREEAHNVNSNFFYLAVAGPALEEALRQRAAEPLDAVYERLRGGV
jgi:hypothetical protein